MEEGTLVSYKIAKQLLHISDFNDETLYKYVYDNNDNLIYDNPISFGAVKNNLNIKSFYTCACPTYESILTWLRKYKKIYVDIQPAINDNTLLWWFRLINLNTAEIILHPNTFIRYDKYEICLEEGIQNALNYIEHLKNNTMNTLETKLQQDLVKAMKDKSTDCISAIRSVKTAIQNEKTLGTYHELTDAEIIKIIEKQVKQRKESIEVYTAANRNELADKEQREMFFLINYLPKMLSRVELTDIINDIITKVNVSSIKDMGKVMKELSTAYAGQYDGKTASDIIKEKLS